MRNLSKQLQLTYVKQEILLGTTEIQNQVEKHLDINSSTILYSNKSVSLLQA